MLKNKILAKVPNYLTATVSWDTSVKNIYSGTAVKYILVQVQHTFQPISNNQKESHCVKFEKKRNFSTQILRTAKEKKKEISRGVRRHAPPENFESPDKNLCSLRHSGGKFEEI